MATRIGGLGVIRLATGSDQAQIEEFLYQHAETSMFLLSNLLNHGIGDSDHKHATTCWVHMQNGQITGVFGIANSGFCVAQAPDAAAKDWADWATQMQGRALHGMTGMPDQVDAALIAFGVQDAAFSVNDDTPLYALDHRNLPDLVTPMRCATSGDEAVLAKWFEGFALDTRTVGSQAQAKRDGTIRAADAIDNPDVMLLVHNDTPVAMAAINARLPEIVQVGGVYTPPANRGRGYARRAVAGLLKAQVGVDRSILFAADKAAARAYEAIGYRLIGAYRVAMLKEPKIVGATS
jgi:RimJ/RimL family protein N-acetyltransferase